MLESRAQHSTLSSFTRTGGALQTRDPGGSLGLGWGLGRLPERCTVRAKALALHRIRDTGSYLNSGVQPNSLACSPIAKRSVIPAM
jgi:hypothetical protein